MAALAFSVGATPLFGSTSRTAVFNVRHASSSPCRRACVSMRAFWVQPPSKTALTTALEHNLTHFVFTDKTFFDQCLPLARFESLFIPDSGHFENGLYCRITCAQDVANLMRQAKSYKTIIIHSEDWKIIPAENLIAACQQSRTCLLATVASAQEARTMFGMLQVGVHGCVLRTDDLAEIVSFAKLKRDMAHSAAATVRNLTFAKVVKVCAVNVGERVCIDTCSMLAEDEGMLIGSSSQAMFVVLSEAAKTAYVPSRPFRVNAGAVHSYCMLAGGSTKYLAEICAGDEVMIVSEFGKRSRTAVVGRAKIESRPLLMIEALVEDEDNNKCNLFVQNAETVRLAVVDENGNGTMQSVSTLQLGTRLLLRSDEKARHIGLPIEEDIIEK